ncbi:MAG: hypothetical protein KJT03_19675 [Verrucomicrobiae bacterium]|nr:hypothetical protein [Verrucomicrobiae bacterium]
MNFVLPGMGATNAMFSGCWRSLDNTSFLDWPKQTAASSIPELADELITRHSMRNGDSMTGTSLGGIVACEIANQLELDQLILIGAAIDKREINYFLGKISPLVNLTPIHFIQHLTGKIDIPIMQMFAQIEPAFMRTICEAIFRWEGLRSGIKPFRIHGKHDSVIPIPEKVDLAIDGGHLIAMTHAEECVKAIGQLLL